MTEPSDILRFLMEKVGHKFSVSFGTEKSVKRHCMIAGCILCIESIKDLPAAVLFIPQYKILFKNRQGHFTIFLINQVEGHELICRIKTKSHDELSEFYQALIFTKGLIKNIIPPQTVFPVNYDSSGTPVEAILCIFENSFEIQSLDGNLLYDDTNRPHADAYCETAETFTIVVIREGFIMARFNARNAADLCQILVILNIDGPAKKLSKNGHLMRVNPEIDQQAIEEESVLVKRLSNEDGPRIVSGPKPAPKPAFDPDMMETETDFIDDETSVSESVSVSVTSITNFTRLKRSALKNFKTGIFETLFIKKRPHYSRKFDAKQLAEQLSIDAAGEANFVPEVNITGVLPRKSRKNMTFNERMEERLQEFEDEMKTYEKIPTSDATLEEIIDKIKRNDPIVSVNPIPIVNIQGNESDAIFSISRNPITEGFFDVPEDQRPHCEPKTKTMSDFNPSDAVKYLNDYGIDTSSLKIQNKPLLYETFLNLLQKSQPSDTPQLLASLLTNALSCPIATAYNSLCCQPLSIREINSTLEQFPFSTFTECCVFFDALLRVGAASLFFACLAGCNVYLTMNYHVDSLMLVPGICESISRMTLKASETRPVFTNLASILPRAPQPSMRIDKIAPKLVETSPTIFFESAVSSDSPIITLVGVILSLYNQQTAAYEKLWSIFWTMSKQTKDKSIISVYEKISSIKKASNSAKLIDFIMVLMLHRCMSKFIINSWPLAHSKTKTPYDDSDAALVAASILRIEKVLPVDNNSECDFISFASKINQVVASLFK